MDQTIDIRFENISKSKTFRNIVRTFDLDKKSVLDIGCSFGEFLAHFGPGSVGITINKEEVDYGKANELDIRYGNADSDEPLAEGKFDVIFANNIFEHLYSPHGFLGGVKGYLKPDGILILGVPCIPKFISLLQIKKFRGSLASAHINYFTRETLVLTARSAGWKIKDTRGFHFANPTIDHLFDPIYPHFYVIATNNPDFKYSKKRMKELANY